MIFAIQTKMSLDQNTANIWLLKDFLYSHAKHKLHTLFSSKPDTADEYTIETLVKLGPFKFEELLTEHPFDQSLQVVENKESTSEFGYKNTYFRYDGQVNKDGNR